MKLPINKFEKLRTPFYFYDTDLLRQTLKEIRNCTQQDQNFQVHYAVKANANPGVLKVIAAEGLGADCVSGGEIEACLTAGFKASKIVFAGVGKADWEIELGIDNEIACFNVESKPELENINEIAGKKDKKARVAFRINPNVDAHTHAKITTGLEENKFGIAMSDMVEAIETAQSLSNVEFVGLHFHIGSQIEDTSIFVPLCERINDLQDELETKGIKVPSINVGGGLGVDYVAPQRNTVPDFKSYFEVFRTHLRLRDGQALHFELGRSVVAQMGAMIAKVLYIKEGHAKKFVITDGGFTDLIRPALYQAHHKILNITSTETEQATYDVVGPICESSDVFDKDVQLPISHRGDYIALLSAGAYGEVMASGYNCRPLIQGYCSEDL